MSRVIALLIVAALLPVSAQATGIAEECREYAEDSSNFEDYDEQQQQDFLANYYALNSSFSSIHAPVPHQPGHGMIGVRGNGLMPLPCRRRFALEHTKTEDTNVSPVLPTLVASFAFDVGNDAIVPYAEAGFLAPINVGGTRNVVFQGAIGIGLQPTDGLQLGVRAHASLQRTIGEIATPFEEGDPVHQDLFLGSTLGISGGAGFPLDLGKGGKGTPFVNVGVLDASTFFYVGDSSVVPNNKHPYLGLDYSLGWDWLFAGERVRLGAEYYGAPGGHRTLHGGDGAAGWSGYGRVHTWRLRAGVEL